MLDGRTSGRSDFKRLSYDERVISDKVPYILNVSRRHSKLIVLPVSWVKGVASIVRYDRADTLIKFSSNNDSRQSVSNVNYSRHGAASSIKQRDKEVVGSWFGVGTSPTLQGCAGWGMRCRF
jgi:hypothetical protein